MMIQILPENRLLIDIFGKLLYLSGLDRYRSPIYIFLCTVIVTLPRQGQISYHFDDSRTLQYTSWSILIWYSWSTFSDWFHTVSFTLQSHDQNWSIPLMGRGYHYKRNSHRYIFASWLSRMGDTTAMIGTFRFAWTDMCDVHSRQCIKRTSIVACNPRCRSANLKVPITFSRQPETGEW